MLPVDRRPSSGQRITAPPLATTVSPVTKRLRSEASIRQCLRYPPAPHCGRAGSLRCGTAASLATSQSVAIPPGATALARICCGPSVLAKLFVRLMTAALAAVMRQPDLGQIAVNGSYVDDPPVALRDRRISAKTHIHRKVGQLHFVLNVPVPVLQRDFVVAPVAPTCPALFTRMSSLPVRILQVLAQGNHASFIGGIYGVWPHSQSRCFHSGHCCVNFLAIAIKRMNGCPLLGQLSRDCFAKTARCAGNDAPCPLNSDMRWYPIL